MCITAHVRHNGSKAIAIFERIVRPIAQERRLVKVIGKKMGGKKMGRRDLNHGWTQIDTDFF
jgi:hypothetical protein